LITVFLGEFPVDPPEQAMKKIIDRLRKNATGTFIVLKSTII